jgi:hypothetical protein
MAKQNQPQQAQPEATTPQAGENKEGAQNTASQNSPVNQPGPNAPPDTQSPPEPKNGAITSDDLRPTRAKRWRVSGFRGSYADVSFNDDGVSDKPVPEKTAEAFRSQFPNAQIEEVAE